MWKRIQAHGREKERTIGNPVLVETTFDEEALGRIPHVSEVHSPTHIHAPRAIRPPPSYDSLSPQEPAEDYRQSALSSVYSQPSSDYRHNANPRTTNPGRYSDISPPASPDPNSQQQQSQPRRFRSMRDVSPVDTNRGAMNTASSIPVLRKVAVGTQNRQSQNPKFWGGKVSPNSQVKWDEYSGEPATNGKSAQVQPRTMAKVLSSSPPGQQEPMGYQVSVSGPNEDIKKRNPSDRASRFTSKPSPIETSAKPREPWRGASGRMAIAEPLEDQPSKKPLKFQRKAVPEERKVLVENSILPTVPAGTGVDSGGVGADTSPVADHRAEFDTHDNPIKPIVPLKVGRNSPPRSIASPTSPTFSAYPYPSPLTPPANQAPRPVNEGETKPSLAQPFSTPPHSKFPRKSLDKSPEGGVGSQFPSSRFSWTTYNTSTTYQHSPPPSPPPPMPAAPAIFNHSRPNAPYEQLPIRKPVTSSTPQPRAVPAMNPPSPRPDSTFTTNTTSTQKALPRPPTELASSDHVEILEAQLDDLRLRRNNVGRLLRDLETRIPSNPLVTDFKKMRLVQQRKKDFEDELADIRREEHEVGLKLHRAWRKREKDDPGSESAIWIRRVTR